MMWCSDAAPPHGEPALSTLHSTLLASSNPAFPPQDSKYVWVAYLAFLALIVVYVGVMAWRQRRVEDELRETIARAAENSAESSHE